MIMNYMQHNAPTVNIHIPKNTTPTWWVRRFFVFSPMWDHQTRKHDFISKLLWTVCKMWAL